MDETAPTYLKPYLKAAEKHRGGFGSLLWASPRTQSARFAAMRRIYDMRGQTILDAGCGRADFFKDMLAAGIEPARYIGIEAVAELADAAEADDHARKSIVRGDFVRDPNLLFAGADVITFSGSLNTLDAFAFETALRTAVRAARRAVIFNFLSSTYLAAGPHLTWHKPAEVLLLAEMMTARVMMLDDYLRGDCTIAMVKPVDG